MAESKGNEAIVVLADTPYYESLESAMKIRKYVKQRNVSQLPKSVQKIISDQQDEAGKYELSAMTELQNAIEGAQFYVDGEHLEIKAGNAKSKIDQSLEYLVAHVYSKLDLITDNAGSDADIIAILTGAVTALPGMEPNRDAASAMEEYLEMQDAKKTSDFHGRCAKQIQCDSVWMERNRHCCGCGTADLFPESNHQVCRQYHSAG